MKHLLVIVILLCSVTATGCLVDDALGAPGDEVLGVEMPGDFSYQISGTATSFRFAVAGPAGFSWGASLFCSLSENASQGGILPPSMGPDADSGGFRVVAIELQPEEALMCLFPVKTVTLRATGRVFQAAPTDQTSIDLLMVAGQPWRAAVSAGLLKCGRYSASSGLKLVAVPCQDPTGRMLAPLVDLRRIYDSDVDEWPTE